MGDRFHVHPTPLAGLSVLEKIPRGDSRGYLERMFCDEELGAAGWVGEIKQINHTFTKKRGTLRGLHYQLPPHSEIKLVSCLRGEIWDVVVDLRRHSSTFLKWHAEVLSAENHRSMLVPEGFAHGFQTLTDDVDMLYFHSTPYAQLAETGVLANDPALGIAWPLPVTDISPRDQGYSLITENFRGVSL